MLILLRRVRCLEQTTLLLGLMIYLQWPSSSNWAVGTLVGVSLIVSGVTRLMLSLAVRKVTVGLASSESRNG